MQQRFSGRVVLVTGGSRGIGEAVCRRIVAEGGRVMVHGRDTGDAEAIADDLGDAARCVTGDLKDAAVCEDIVHGTVRAFGRIDGLVNNAGIYPRHSVEQATAEVFDHIFHVNTRAPLLSSKAAIAAFQTQGSAGSVVTIGSINGWSGQPDLTVYSMSKGALMTMTRNLGDVLFREEGVRVNQINPGWVLTENEILRKRSHGLADDWHRHLPREFCPAGRLIEPTEIAAAAVYWLADECGPISGQVVDLEQHPFIGRNPAKTIDRVPGGKPA